MTTIKVVRYYLLMEEISVTEFKATCLKVIERVRTAGISVLLLKNGKPAAMLAPPPKTAVLEVRSGALKGRARVVGDIISPVARDEWEVLK